MSLSTDHDSRVCIYPAYINKKHSLAQGRKIPRDKACDNPTTPEMYDCVTRGLGLQAEMQNKTHPCDFLARGRVRVALVGLDGAPLNPDIPDRRTLLLRVAELVPRHPGRSAKAKAAAAAAAAAAAGGGAGPSAGAKAGGKKGKKGRR